jgi:hypothetical protein
MVNYHWFSLSIYYELTTTNTAAKLLVPSYREEGYTISLYILFTVNNLKHQLDSHIIGSLLSSIEYQSKTTYEFRSLIIVV